MPIPKQIAALLSGELGAVSVSRSGPATQALLAQSILQSGRSVMVVLPEQKAFDSFVHLLTLLGENVDGFPDSRWTALPGFLPGRMDTEGWSRRMSGLFSLVSGRGPRGIVATVDNLLPLLPPRHVVEQELLFLGRGESIDPHTILEQAVAWGYERVNLVTRVGELSLRGDVLDLFCPGYGRPLRLEFFGDTLESLRTFEPLTQRSTRELEEAVVLPVLPSVHSEDRLEAAGKVWEHLWVTGELSKTGRNLLQREAAEEKKPVWPGLFYPDPTTLDQWVATDAVCLLVGADRLRSRLEDAAEAWRHFASEKEARGYALPEKGLVQSVASARATWVERPQILFEDLASVPRAKTLALPEKQYGSFEELFWRPEQRRRPWKSLVEALGQWRRTRRQTVVSFLSEQSRHRFLKLMEGEDLSFHTRYAPEQTGLFALVSPVRGGYDLIWQDLLLLGELVVQPGAGERQQVVRSSKFVGLRRYDDLVPEELLVHRDYGLARFGGLQHLTVDQSGNDYLLLLFSGEDKLYVPVDRLNLVQRYKGPEGASPPLDRLGGTRWKNATARVRKAVEKIAHDLVAMYAYRKVTKGHQYSPPDEMFQEFEASFGFEETPDQEQAIKEVLSTMEQPEPMDMLVCGDVGFGKTEVGMRAAFRAVLDGKQVALLCPTTVLAEQHFQNFQQRMEEFSVSVAMLSRFVPAARQKAILQAASRGGVDILIGTHRILSKDVHLPNLSLLILDEEQRFGVKHKERIKKMRQNIDVLVLTATPIPRTLQLSLSGIRKLSVMETPPPERKAVETSLIEKDRDMLRTVLERELERGGQVFWVHNRVQSLARELELVRSLVPTARVDMAHGQMKEHQLEKVMHSFWHGELDVLVCTSIIESGLDFPRANTLIVNQAQRFGLGQLYQLRGRVGRSRHQAFAYFVVPSVERLSATARKRLQTILDADYLGAGFQVAMDDLRLRGAGNILGEVQSGNIAKVGLDLFLEMLEQEVRRLRGEPVREVVDPELTIGFASNIPESYVADAQDRLRYYKALSSARSEQELEQLKEEVHDRFGPLPQAVDNLLAVLKLKLTLGALQAVRAELYENRVVVVWPEDTVAVSPEALVDWVRDNGREVRLLPPAKLELRMEDKAGIARNIQRIAERLNTLRPDFGPVSAEDAPRSSVLH